MPNFRHKLGTPTFYVYGNEGISLDKLYLHLSIVYEFEKSENTQLVYDRNRHRTRKQNEMPRIFVIIAFIQISNCSTLKLKRLSIKKVFATLPNTKSFEYETIQKAREFRIDAIDR